MSVGVVSTAHLAGTTTHASPATVPAEPKLDWKSCGDGSECAKLTVPLDYEHPDNGRTMKVALLRVPAADRKNRIGSLLMNPGGPGAPGTEFARDFASILPDKITKRFDIVGFDPAGAAKRAR